MTTKVGAWNAGKWRFCCPFTSEYFGPIFTSQEAIYAFQRWFDGDPRFVGTMVDGNSWQEIVSRWVSREEGARYRDQIMLAPPNPHV